jgi:RHS repeat-associated protein
MKRLFILFSLFLFGMNGFAQNITRPNIIGPNGFEVNSYTGNLYYQRTDLKIPARGLNVEITFSYNISRRSKDWGFGKGWTFTYNMAYTPDTVGGIYIERMDGRRDLFKKNGTKYIAPIGVFDSLYEYQSGKFILREKGGTKYYFDNNTHKKLTKIEDRNNNTITLGFTDSLLTTLTDASNRTISFTWTNGRLTEITDNFGTPQRKIKYEYDTAGNPAKVTNPMNYSKSYIYDKENKIVGMTDERSNNTSIAYNANNAVKNIVSCLTNQAFSYILSQLKTLVTENVNGQQQITFYQYDTVGRLTEKKGNCCGYNIAYEYDNNNNIKVLIDGNKYKFLYTYDNKGNLAKETDPLGYTTVSTYDALYFKTLTLKDKNSNTTSYEYDPNGNRTKIILGPLNITEQYTYTNKGEISTYKNGNGNTTAYEYNANGYLTKITNAEGGVISYIYDARGNRISETDARGLTTAYEYDALNRPIKKTDALGSITAYTYDEANNLKAVTNALGKTTTYEYDGLNRRIKETSPLGIVTQTIYDERGNVVKQIDGMGNATTYTYNMRNQVLSETDALGNTETSDYDDAGNKISSTDKNGNTIKYEYDALHHLTKITNAFGGTTVYGYDANGNRITETNPNGNTTKYEYDAKNRLIKLIDPLNKAVVYNYDNNDNLVQENDKANNATLYEYDKLNRLKKKTDAMGGIETYTYDANGNPLTLTNALNYTTSRAYDALNRPTSVTDPVGDITAYQYDAVGNLIKTIQPNSNNINLTYDGDNRAIKATDNIGIIVQYTYDKNGKVVTETDGVNNTITYVYDALNRQTKTIFANGTSQQAVYDKTGNKTKDINQKNYATQYEYDALNRLVKTTDALGFSASFAFDANGNRTNVIDAKGNITSYSYDVLNRLVKYTFPDGSSKSYTYTPADQPLTRKDNNGIITQYSYDKLNRLTKRTYPGNVADNFTYDAIGRMTAAINADATVLMTYDATNRLLSENLNNRIISYSYNTASRTKNINYPSGMQLLWNLDDRNRLAQINEGGSMQVTFKYDNADRLTTKAYRNNTTTNYTYDNVNNVTNIQVSPLAKNIMNVSYKYDSLNNRIITERVHRPAFSEIYAYDALLQLTTFKLGTYKNGSIVTPAQQYQFNYDGLGNRTITVEDGLNRNYATNNLNQYTKIAANNVDTILTYNLNGNTLTDGRNIYSYDYENHLVKVQNNTATVNYKYDALGRRISRSFSGIETKFSYDDHNLIEESENSTAKNYVFGNGIDQILFSKNNTSAFYYHTDLLNSVQSLTDASGNLIEHYTYEAFGLPHIYNSSNIEQVTSAINNIFFTGRTLDFQSNTYDYRNREMNPVYGRFLQRDKIDEADDLNVYTYVKNNGINLTDPFGNIPHNIHTLLHGAFDLALHIIRDEISKHFKDCKRIKCPTPCKFCCGGAAAAISLIIGVEATSFSIFCTGLVTQGILPGVACYIATATLNATAIAELTENLEDCMESCYRKPCCNMFDY